MAHIIKTNNISVLNIFKNKNIQLFIDKSIDIAKQLDKECHEKLIYNNDIFSIPQNTILKNSLDCIFESHKEYIDIHIILNGIENVELININKVSAPYEQDLKNDYYLYENQINTDKVILDKDTIGIFFFEDVHKVGIQSSNIQENVIKVVLKIRKNIFEKEFIYGK